MRRSHARSSSAHRALAWLSVAALLGLLLIQPFHGTVGPDPEASEATATAIITVRATGSDAPVHDAGACSVCRAASQVRSGLRSAVQLVGTTELLQSLHPVPTPLLRSAEVLRHVWPRAPPAAHSA